MPADLLTPVLEIVVQGICYFSMRLLLPIISFGRVSVEPADRAKPISFKWHQVHRTAGGKIVLSADMAMLIGLIFWIAVIAIGVVTYLLV